MHIDPSELRTAFGRFMTGVTIVTAVTDQGEPVGFTANSFSSVSLDPPLLLVCPGKHLTSFETFKTVRHFGVSVLSADQQDVSRLFAGGKGPKFEQCDWAPAAFDVPMISGRAAGFVCEVSNIVPAGDHIILLGQILDFDDTENPGLGYGPGGYFTIGHQRLSVD